MEKSDWKDIVDNAPQHELTGSLWRVVESQMDIATNQLVDSLEEQSLLETMLEESKPPLPEETLDFSYLLSTPFRYPPLEWGSRFGSKDEASLFYGSREYGTAFAELAFYRLVFRSALDDAFPNPRISTNHTLFSAEYYLTPGMDLTKKPFDQYSDILKHRSDYSHAKNLGSVLRSKAIEGFYFSSARCPAKGQNIAIFVPSGLRSTSPTELRQCYCETTQGQVTIKLEEEILVYPMEGFLQDGQMPMVP